jgi:hypothetical protein
MDFSRSTSNQTIIFFSNFCADFGWSSGCHLGDFLIDSIWHKISNIWDYNVTGYPVILEISGHFMSWSLATVMVMSSKPKPHAHRKLFFSCCWNIPCDRKPHKNAQEGSERTQEIVEISQITPWQEMLTTTLTV